MFPLLIFQPIRMQNLELINQSHFLKRSYKLGQLVGSLENKYIDQD